MKKYVILIPVYNDWQSVFKLLHEIDSYIEKFEEEVSILIINDASTENKSLFFSKLNFKNIKSVRLINMKENRGHARCNAAGLKFLTEKENFDHVVLMDADGEDRPEDLLDILNKSKENPSKAITADRIKRSEGFFFKFLYECHKILTFLFTGKYINFGNYTCLPREIVQKLSKESSIWSSFSGSLIKVASQDRVSVPSTRGKRYYGPSQMNLFKLLIHSFAIIAVFKTSVIIRSILFLIFYSILIYNQLSILTLFPVLVIFIFLFFIFKISKRENFDELKKSLENIKNIETL